MSIVRFTPQLIPTLQCPPDKTRIEWCDSELPGLYLLVSSVGNIATYFLRYKDQNGKTCHRKIGRTGDTDLATARKQAKTLKAEIALGRNPHAEKVAKKAILTYTEFFGNHLQPYSKPRKRSWSRDEEMFRLRIKAAFGDKRLNQITRQQIQSFHTELLAKGLAPATCDHHVKLLKSSLNLAVDWGLLEKNPAARVPLYNQDNMINDYLEQDELERLLTVLRTDENRTICLIAMFLLSTGARLNEALTATWIHVDRNNRVWRIAASNSKSKRVRSVPLNDSALDVLEQLETEGKFENLFVNLKTKLPYTTITKVWTRLRKKAGLPHLRIHSLRHTFASLLANDSHSLYTIQQILGHSQPIVTQRYAHLSSKSLQTAANSASIMIKGASKTAAAVSVVAVPASEVPVVAVPAVEIPVVDGAASTSSVPASAVQASAVPA